MSQGFTSPAVADNAVTNEKLRPSLPLSVIGNAFNTAGDPGDIAIPLAAQLRGRILRVESGPALAYGLHSRLGVEKSKYHPDREPSTGLDPACSDNFFGNVEHATWRWGNQGTSTLSLEMDTAFLDPQRLGTQSNRTRWMTAPSAIDFCFTAKIIKIMAASVAVAFTGICILETGTEATPTKIQMAGNWQNPNQNYQHQFQSDYVGTGATADANWIVNDSVPGQPWCPIYWQYRYVASTKALSAYFSEDGMTWHLMVTKTLTAHPISIGYFGDPRSSGAGLTLRVHWVRTFSAGINGATTAQYLSGQVGSR